MFIKMNKQEFDTLEDEALVAICFEPFISKIRGKSNTVKQEVYKQLNTGQKALFMFSVYFNHARNSLAEFYWWSAYYLAQPNAWSEIKSALRYFKAEEMQRLVEEIERVLVTRDFPSNLEEFNVSYNDLENDPQLLATIGPLNTIFTGISPATLKIIGEYIRNNPLEFICIED
ncbi:hypothetical protein ACFVSW_02050 [Neobacillus sp. NPDC058068]|uniref:hypothetical protein n=1 Tax=Neobacillus sp. NPDC058068 TaxID=3346325 RepID=UPI0036D898DC